MSGDTEILAICARLQIVDSEYLAFDEFHRGSPEEVCRVGEARDAIIERLGELKPVTAEGAKAMARAVLPLLRDLDTAGVWEPLITLIGRVAAAGAGVPALGDQMPAFRPGTDLGGRFALAVRMHGGMAQ